MRPAADFTDSCAAAVPARATVRAQRRTPGTGSFPAPRRGAGPGGGRWLSVEHCRSRATGVVIAGLAILSAACSATPPDVSRPVSQAWPRPEETELGLAYAAQLAEHPRRSGLYPLVSGMDALSIRAGLAEGAQHTLDLQYYIVRADTTTQLLLARVLRASQRGVRVRMLVDDLDALGKDVDLATFASFANVEVRVFNPFATRGALGLTHVLEFIGNAQRLNRRMHNKLWIADNAMAVVGGRNLGDEYFDASGAVNFTDLDVLAAGPVVSEVSHSFDNFWNSELAVPIQSLMRARPGPEQLAAYEQTLQANLERLRNTDYARALRETRLGPALLSGRLALTVAPVSALYDPPSKVSADAAVADANPLFASRVRPVIDAASKELILISPYFIPSERGLAALTEFARRGVKVRILTNSLASADYVPLAHAGYALQRHRLLAAGLELHEMRPERTDIARSRRVGGSSAAYLHTKAIVIDRRHVVVGSMNFDPRSRLSNTEVGILVDSPAFGAALGTLFDDAVAPARAFRVTLADPAASSPELRWTSEEDGKATHYDHEPLVGLWRRFLSWTLGVVASVDLL